MKNFEILNNYHLSILILNQKNEIIYTNKKCLNFFKVKSDELPRFQNLNQHNFLKIIEKQGKQPCELKISLLNATFKSVCVNVSNIESELNDSTMVMLSFSEIESTECQSLLRDIDYYKTEFDKLSNQYKSLVYQISHDLKAPLRNVLTLSNWIVTDNHKILDDSSKEQLKLMEAQVDKMNRMLEAILDLSRINTAKRKDMKVSVNETLAEIISEYENIDEIKLLIDDEMPEILMDKLIVKRMLKSLVDNSIQHGIEGEGIINIGYQKNENYFYVRDNGTGIKTKYHEEIFNIFKSFNEKKPDDFIGAGLTITKKILEQYKCEIWLINAMPKGVEFRFRLPIV